MICLGFCEGLGFIWSGRLAIPSKSYALRESMSAETRCFMMICGSLDALMSLFMRVLSDNLDGEYSAVFIRH